MQRTARRACAWFWIPLPAPVGLPDGFAFGIGNDDLTVVTAVGEGVDAGVAHFRGTLRVHQLPDSVSDDNRISALAGAAASSLGESLGEVDEAMPKGHLTVIEVGVPLNWPDPDVMPTEDALTDAFDTAAEEVRRLQAACQRLSGLPLAPLRRGHLPTAVPMVIGWVDGGWNRTVAHGPEAFFINASALPAVAARPLDDRLDEFSTVLQLVHDDEVLWAYQRLKNRALALWEADGDGALAVVVANTAAEVLLDEVLGLLLWEEHVLPGVAAAAYTGNDALARMKSRLERRLGSGWDPRGTSGPGPDYAQYLAALRNRVVHAGFVPNRIQVLAGLATLDTLTTAAEDALLTPDRLARYPLTALSVAGEARLEERGLLTRRVRQLIGDYPAVECRAAYGRWRWHVDRLRSGAPDEHGADPDVCDVFALADGGITTWLYDRRTRHVAAVDLAAADPERFAGLERLAVARTPSGDPWVTWPTRISEPPALEPTGPWRPDWEVFPRQHLFHDDGPGSESSLS